MSNTATLQFNHIDHVIDGVYIGGIRAFYDIRHMQRAHILYVLKLYEYDPFWPKPFRVLEVAVTDGVPLPRPALERGVRFIHKCVQRQQPVLVQCGAGISRSSTFVLAYLIERGMDLFDAYRLLQRQHSAAAPAMALWQSLIDYYQFPYTPFEAMQWMCCPAQQ